MERNQSIALLEMEKINLIRKTRYLSSTVPNLNSNSETVVNVALQALNKRKNLQSATERQSRLPANVIMPVSMVDNITGLISFYLLSFSLLGLHGRTSPLRSNRMPLRHGDIRGSRRKRARAWGMKDSRISRASRAHGGRI